MTLVDPTCMTVSDLALEPVACVQPGTSLAQGARVLAATGLGVLAVETVPLAEVTEADVVEALASGRSPVTYLVEILRGGSQFVRPDTSADDAAAIMIVSGRRALIVVDEGRALGAITLRSAIGALWGGKSWLGALRIALHVERA
jgi:CBS domain-containing protein